MMRIKTHQSWLSHTSIAFLLLNSGLVYGAELLSLEVTRKDQRYVLHAKAFIAADVNIVYGLISDYENLTSINPFLKESKIVAQGQRGTQIVKLVTETCIMFICKRLRHLQSFRTEENGDLYADIIPRESDFKYGWLRWRAVARDDGAMVVFDSEVVPDFKIPPVLGPYIVKSKMLEMTRKTIAALEKRAWEFE